MRAVSVQQKWPGGLLLYGHPDEAAVLGPRPVVVAHVVEPEQLLQHKPRMRGALADAAVGDDVLVRSDALGLVQGLELVGGLERAVLVHGLRPRDVGRAGDVARDLSLLLREVRRREE